ncbi:MAG: hypothetical protein U0414_17285 [Polyangiaceae bacterium]
MPSNRSALVASLTVGGLVVGAFFFSAAGGCQLLSGISDLEATGGNDAVSASSSGTTVTSSTTATMVGSSGSGMLCDEGDCVACGVQATTSKGLPPYCDGGSTGTVMGMAGQCDIVSCNTTGMKEGCCTPGAGSTTLDTAVMPMHVGCSADNCDGETITCFEHMDMGASEGHIYPCSVDCPAGTCNKNMVVDCSKTFGTCSVTCHGDACAGLTLKCGANLCELHCVDMPNPTMIKVQRAPMKPCVEPLIDMECKATVM